MNIIKKIIWNETGKNNYNDDGNKKEIIRNGKIKMNEIRFLSVFRIELYVFSFL